MIRRTAQLEPVPGARNRIGLFYWSVELQAWYRMLDVTNDRQFVVRSVETGDVTRFQTLLDARYFASAPFNVAEVYGTLTPF